MPRIDARRLRHQELTALRRRGVAAVQAGEPPATVARVLGVHVVTLYGWLARYRQGGWPALNAAKRGGRPARLDAKALAWLYRTLVRKDPRQLQFPFALWTSRMVQALLERRFGIRLSKASVCRLLAQLGLSPQRPVWRAFQQDPERVARWRQVEYPRIRRLARTLGATIYFGDEAGLRSDGHAGTTWAPRGQTPVVKTSGARFGCNVLSAISPPGAMRFMLVRERVTAAVVITFLKRLLYGATGPIFLILDGHPAHKAAAVSHFVASTQGQLRLFFLPPYSPELNPDEHVWNDLKNHALGRTPITGPAHLHRTALSHLRRVQRSPAIVAAYFRAPATRYAAA